MKKLIVASLFLGMGMTSFAAPFVSQDTSIVKVDRKKNKKKGHKKTKHKKCEAFQG